MSTTNSTSKEHRASARPAMLLIAGFGDDASMFSGLLETPLADAYRLFPLDLPGFGAPVLDQEATLQSLAHFVVARAKEIGAEILVAHSVASIIASLAAAEPSSTITTILSLEGNLTAEDAYFSGTAGDYDDPQTFRSAFLTRLDEMSRSQPEIGRYRRIVSRADPTSLWRLGSDARRFSAEQVPGEVLASAAKVIYFYNPDNCPKSSVEWLNRSSMQQVVLEEASHWASVDRPSYLAEKMLSVL